MNDRQYAAQKRRFERFHKKWRPVFALGDWEATVTFSRDSSEMSPMTVPGLTECMEIEVAWQYQKYHIRVSMPSLIDMPDESLEERVIHELSHIAVEHLADLLLDRVRDQPILEETVTKLTNIVARAYWPGHGS